MDFLSDGFEIYLNFSKNPYLSDFCGDIFFVRSSHKRGHKKIQPAKTPILSGFSTFIRQNSGKRFCRVKRHFSFVIGLELFHNLLTNRTI